MTTGSERITKKQWYARGGLQNSRCWRRQLKNGAWAYYYVVDATPSSYEARGTLADDDE